MRPNAKNNLGFKHSKESKLKMSQTHKIKNKSIEVIHKMSLTHKKRYKELYQIDTYYDNMVVNEFASHTQARKFLNLSHWSLLSYIKGDILFNRRYKLTYDKPNDNSEAILISNDKILVNFEEKISNVNFDDCNIKPIVKIKNNEIVELFTTHREISAYYNNSNKMGKIKECLSGKRKSAYGFQWRYFFNNEVNNSGN